MRRRSHQRHMPNQPARFARQRIRMPYSLPRYRQNLGSAVKYRKKGWGQRDCMTIFGRHLSGPSEDRAPCESGNRSFSRTWNGSSDMRYRNLTATEVRQGLPDLHAAHHDSGRPGPISFQPTLRGILADAIHRVSSMRSWAKTDRDLHNCCAGLECFAPSKCRVP